MLNDDECIICLSGCKETRSRQWDLFNSTPSGYLLGEPISLSTAYNCACKSNAHRKCLWDVQKCPTCRQPVTKTKLLNNLVSGTVDFSTNMNWVVSYLHFLEEKQYRINDRINNVRGQLRLNIPFWIATYIISGIFTFVAFVSQNQHICVNKLAECLDNKNNANDFCEEQTRINCRKAGFEIPLIFSLLIPGASFITVFIITDSADVVKLFVINLQLHFLYVITEILDTLAYLWQSIYKNL